MYSLRQMQESLDVIPPIPLPALQNDPNWLPHLAVVIVTINGIDLHCHPSLSWSSASSFSSCCTRRIPPTRSKIFVGIFRRLPPLLLNVHGRLKEQIRLGKLILNDIYLFPALWMPRYLPTAAAHFEPYNFVCIVPFP